MTVVIRVAGGTVLFMVLALLFYLVKEGSNAFGQEFPYGYRFSLQPAPVPADYDLEIDPMVSTLKSHWDGADGVDDKEDGIYMPTLEELRGSSPFGTGTALTDSLEKVKPDELYRDDWRTPDRAEIGDAFLFFAFATPEYSEAKMTLVWAPDAAFDPAISPYDLRLKLIRAPDGVDTQAINIDLKKQPNGRIELPTYIAKTDDERTGGYVFQLVATPQTSTFLATVRNFFRTDWAPTLQYPRFGFVPLLIATISITLVALLLATPVSLGLAVYLAEFAPARLREWLKPTIELLASVPTVVLGYFGLILVAPGMQNVFASALSMQSGVNMLTASVVLAVLLIPTIATVSEDTLSNLPHSLRDGGDALGLTDRETLQRVVLPAAKTGLLGSILLGLARAFGETMIIWMLSGGTPRMPTFAGVKDGINNLGQTTRGMADTVAIEMGNVDFGGLHYGHLFLLGSTLFVITLTINLYGYLLARRSAWN